MKNRTIISSLLICNLLITAPASVLALQLEDFSVPQGETLELVIPRFEYSEATGNYDGKSFAFYEITEQIPPTAPISRAEFVQLIYQNQPLTAISSTEDTTPLPPSPPRPAQTSPMFPTPTRTSQPLNTPPPPGWSTATKTAFSTPMTRSHVDNPQKSL